MPVYDGTLDNIVGFAFVKDLVRYAEGAPPSIRELLRPAHFVPETKKVPGLLQEFQRERVQSAIVVDEYGGTAGLVTFEDLIEEIVGEIRDEYDVETEPVVDEGQGIFVVSGKADVSVLEHQFGVDDRARRIRLGGRLPAGHARPRADQGRTGRCRRPGGGSARRRAPAGDPGARAEAGRRSTAESPGP